MKVHPLFGLFHWSLAQHIHWGIHYPCHLYLLPQEDQVSGQIAYSSLLCHLLLCQCILWNQDICNLLEYEHLCWETLRHMFPYWLKYDTCSFTGWTMRHVPLLVGLWDMFPYWLDNETCSITVWTIIHVQLLVGQWDMFLYWLANEPCSVTG